MSTPIPDHDDEFDDKIDKEHQYHAGVTVVKDESFRKIICWLIAFAIFATGLMIFLSMWFNVPWPKLPQTIKVSVPVVPVEPPTHFYVVYFCRTEVRANTPASVIVSSTTPLLDVNHTVKSIELVHPDQHDILVN